MYIGLIDEKYEGTRSVEIDVDTLRDLTYSDMTTIYNPNWAHHETPYRERS